MARLVPCLAALRAEFDALFPARDRASDGWIGDPAHQARDSDHNPDPRGLVHALDVDAGLGAPMDGFVRHVVERCHAGLERRLTYVIWNRRIAALSHGWTWRPYLGSNPHTEHAHFSASKDPAREQNTSSWHLEEVPVALTDDDKQWLAAEIRRVVTGDADPGERTYSLGGMVATIERRTANFADRLAAIEKRLPAPPA